MANVIIVGTQWGDEGKGKIVDLLTPSIDVVVRYQGGANAGHTVIIGEQKTILHLVPSGILHEKCLCIIANGVVVDPKVLIDEIDGLHQQGYLKDPSRLLLSAQAHLVLPYHRLIDGLREEEAGGAKIGTTGRGIGPAYEDKVCRIGIRAGDLVDAGRFCRRLEAVLPIKNRTIEMLGGKPVSFDELAAEAEGWSARLGRHVVDSEALLHEQIAKGKRILFEGAQGTALDIDHGTYPFVTSSNTVSGGACCGAGVGPTMIDEVLGIAKAYTTRVGNGPFPTELSCEVGEKLQTNGKEFGSTTGRRRRCGWFDAVVARHAVRVNGVTMLAITKLDVLSGIDTLKICTGYRVGGETIDHFPSSVERFDNLEPVYEEMPGFSEDISSARSFKDLPRNAQGYVERVAELCGCRISIISVGSERSEHIMIENPF
ncbi:MAG TPA: adenylosuccinate synthase [bacterium]|nr:adenylosuccinate synthase [bacterium]